MQDFKKNPETSDPKGASTPASGPDNRTAAVHLANIREVFSPRISDLARAFGVSRPDLWQWIDGRADPEAGQLERIRSLSHAADAFRETGVPRARSMLNMKEFDGQTMLDLVSCGELSPDHVRRLIGLALAMDADYRRLRLDQSKAPRTDDWCYDVCFPGYLTQKGFGDEER